MNTRKSRLLTRFFLFLSLTALVGAATIDQRTSEQIHILAQYSEPIGDQTTFLLHEIGYSPPVPEVEWRSYPAVRKLEFAYRAAEKSKAGKGKDVLAFVAVRLGEQFDALSEELHLKEFVGATPDPKSFNFARGPPQSDWPALPRQLRKQVTTLARYASRSFVGSTYDVLLRDLNLTESQAYDVTVSSNSHEEALKRGFASLSDSNRQAAMRSLAEKIAGHTDAIYEEKILADYLPPREKKGPLWANDFPGTNSMEPPPPNPPNKDGGEPGPDTGPNKPPDAGPSGPTGPGPNKPPDAGPSGRTGARPNKPPNAGPPAPNSRPSVGPASTTTARPIVSESSRMSRERAATSYRSFVNQQYKSPSTRSFRSMTRAIRGFGGVIFGSPVIGPKEITAVKSIRFESTGVTNSQGQLRFSFDGKDDALFDGVDAETAAIARTILFDPPAGIDAPKLEEGIGLAGIEDNLPSIYPTSGPRQFVSGSRFNVILHPALANTELGWCVLSVDALPIVNEWLVFKARTLAGPDVAGAIEHLWAMQKAGTWKVTDVPMEVVFGSDGEKRSLLIRRVESKRAAFPSGLRTLAFLQMLPLHGFAPDRDSANEDSSPPSASGEVATFPDNDFADSFYRTVPMLIRISRDYDGANKLARVMGVLRWAKSLGATFESSNLPAPSERSTPLAIVVRRDVGIDASEPYTVDSKSIGAAYEDVKNALTQLMNKSEVVREVAEIDARLAALSTSAEQKLEPLLEAMFAAEKSGDKQELVKAEKDMRVALADAEKELGPKHSALQQRRRELSESKPNREVLAGYQDARLTAAELSRLQASLLRELHDKEENDDGE